MLRAPKRAHDASRAARRDAGGRFFRGSRSERGPLGGLVSANLQTGPPGMRPDAPRARDRIWCSPPILDASDVHDFPLRDAAPPVHRVLARLRREAEVAG